MSGRGEFEGRCALCGIYTKGVYCYAHGWAGHEPKRHLKAPDIVAAMPELATAAPSKRTYADGWNAHAEYVAQTKNGVAA